MRRLAPLALILLILATSLSLGAARGQMQVDGAVILCSGTTVSVQPAGPDGHPGRRALICPDMAPGLMAAIALPALSLPERLARPALVDHLATVLTVGQGLRPRQGRGPPVG